MPLQAQNRTMIVHGKARATRDEDEDCLEVPALEALDKEAGWHFNDRGWKSLMPEFVDPTFNSRG